MKEKECEFALGAKHGKPLTEREYEVLKLIVEGESNSEIAEALSISVHTAKAHVGSIIQKMAVTIESKRRSKRFEMVWHKIFSYDKINV